MRWMKANYKRYQVQLRSNLLKAARFSLPEALRLLEELEIRIDG